MSLRQNNSAKIYSECYQKNNYSSRCICSSHNGWCYCCWWNLGFLLSFFWSYYGSHCNGTCQMVSQNNRFYIWGREWILNFCPNSPRAGKMGVAIWATVLMIFLKIVKRILVLTFKQLHNNLFIWSCFSFKFTCKRSSYLICKITIVSW